MQPGFVCASGRGLTLPGSPCVPRGTVSLTQAQNILLRPESAGGLPGGSCHRSFFKLQPWKRPEARGPPSEEERMLFISFKLPDLPEEEQNPPKQGARSARQGEMRAGVPPTGLAPWSSSPLCCLHRWVFLTCHQPLRPPPLSPSQKRCRSYLVGG